jgi:nicotinate-nucleotide pyrophosphorylase (carboxylating)
MIDLITIDKDDLTAAINQDVASALQEDLQENGDLTAHLIDANTHAKARIISREHAVFCGKEWAVATFSSQSPDAKLIWHKKDGDLLTPDEVVVEIEGNARALLTAERTALNFMQLLSGVATKTRGYVDQIVGTHARIVDTRKTIPGLRLAQKYAVTVGGGTSHRLGLYDAVLIKENHIMAAGSISKAVAATKEQPIAPKFIEVEVETHEQLIEALRANVTMVLLDNMNIEALKKSVEINAAEQKLDPSHGALLEASGNVSMDTVRDIAETGVDRISIGGLTKHVRATDYSMRFVM